MSILNAFLASPRTQRALHKHPGDEGFSLIELVVVIAVLAVLAAIALPNFLGVTDDGAVRAAQNAVTNSLKECKIQEARGNNAATFSPVALNGFTISNGTAAAGAGNQNCFGSTHIGAYPATANKYPIFAVTYQGAKVCTRGTTPVTGVLGCSATGTWE
jgi:prepilin-type N-terminal cleavage/methylation domain-containing protein